MADTTTCLYCLATGVPVEWDPEQEKMVAVTHDDEAHGTSPCLGSGK